MIFLYRQRLDWTLQGFDVMILLAINGTGCSWCWMGNLALLAFKDSRDDRGNLSQAPLWLSLGDRLGDLVSLIIRDENWCHCMVGLLETDEVDTASAWAREPVCHQATVICGSSRCESLIAVELHSQEL